MKLLVNEAKLTGFRAMNCATIQQVLQSTLSETDTFGTGTKCPS